MTESTAIQLSEVQRLVQTKGEDALGELGGDAYLLEIPTQSPSGFYGEPASTKSGTVEHDSSILLELGRSPAGQVQVWPITGGATVGRSSSNVVSFPEDDSLSKTHVVFTRTGTGWSIEDKASTNGTFIDQQRIPDGATKDLQSPTHLQIGGRRFMFLLGDDLLALFSQVTSLEPIPMAQLKSELETLGSRRFMLRHTRSYLVLAYKGQANVGGDFKPDAAFPLLGDNNLTLGRTSQADLTIRDKSISKWHAKLHKIGESWSLEDTASSNGTQINGRRLAPNSPQKLANWDAITIGNKAYGLFLNARALLEHLMDS